MQHSQNLTETYCENLNSFAFRVIQVFAYLMLDGNQCICAVSSLTVGKMRGTKASLNGFLGKVLLNNLFKGLRNNRCNVDASVIFVLLVCQA